MFFMNTKLPNQVELDIRKIFATTLDERKKASIDIWSYEMSGLRGSNLEVIWVGSEDLKLSLDVYSGGYVQDDLKCQALRPYK
jgi:hypothetical protein